MYQNPLDYQQQGTSRLMVNGNYGEVEAINL